MGVNKKNGTRKVVYPEDVSETQLIHLFITPT